MSSLIAVAMRTNSAPPASGMDHMDSPSWTFWVVHASDRMQA
jgi:hypothetical protein